MTLMLLWRIWFAHNEVTHEKALPPIEGSRRFLRSYWESLLLIKQHPMADLEKGKMVILHTEHPTGYGMNKRENKVRQQWMPPARGMLKLNVDGSYANDTTAGAGAVLRDHVGAVVFATCWQVEHCIDATEAELAAMELGIAQAMTVTPDRIVLESDCAEAIALIKRGTPNTSKYAARVHEIREMVWEREIQIAKIDRTANFVSHQLAYMGRIQGLTRTWRQHFPQEVVGALDTDCNSIQF
jgi:ribonuclease HI